MEKNSKISETNLDYLVPIECPICSEMVVHRYQCQCQNKWGYCTNTKCVYFWCSNCQEEAKVNWSNMPAVETLMTREQREMIERISGVEIDPEEEEKERVALQKIFDEWDDNPENWKLDPRKRVQKQNPDNPLLKDRLVS